jgi:hypothetical protein
MNQRFPAPGVWCLGLFLVLPQGVGAATISKCQDADGQWHYGDFAAEVCAQSRVIKMNSQGVKVGEDAAPLTPEQLVEREKNLAKEREIRRLAEEKEAKRRRIVAIYDSEADIARARDTHLAAINQRKVTEESILSGLRGRMERLDAQIAEVGEAGPGREDLLGRQKSLNVQIRRFDVALAKSLEEQAKVISDYEEELAVYRDLTGVSTD